MVSEKQELLIEEGGFQSDSFGLPSHFTFFIPPFCELFSFLNYHYADAVWFD